MADRRNTIIQVNRTAKTALDVFYDILEKEKLKRNDLELLINEIRVYENHLELKLRSDIDGLLRCGTWEEAVNFNTGIENILNCRIVQNAEKRPDKVLDVSVIREGNLF